MQSAMTAAIAQDMSYSKHIHTPPTPPPNRSNPTHPTHQRLAELAVQLAAQHVEVVGRGGAVHNLCGHTGGCAEWWLLGAQNGRCSAQQPASPTVLSMAAAHPAERWHGVGPSVCSPPVGDPSTHLPVAGLDL